MKRDNVAPFVGAWIEISTGVRKESSPGVAPFVGAWIEIKDVYNAIEKNESRSLRGSVD